MGQERLKHEKKGHKDQDAQGVAEIHCPQEIARFALVNSTTHGAGIVHAEKAFEKPPFSAAGAALEEHCE
jgi:hypothetical protein